MPRQDRLEIVGPGGQVEFYLLDPARGVTNIGRHPDNDVVLDSPSIDLFQAVLDHQEKPYHIMILSEEAEARLGGQLLVPNVSQELHAWDTVEMDGYAIILLEGAGVAEHEEAAPAPLPAVPPARQAAAAPAGFVPVSIRPLDELDEIIVAELSEREWTIDVEQTASLELTVTNGGSIVATFEVRLEGVDGRWVTISPDTLNLNEGARGTVALTITPPRLPTSNAGPHHLAVVVTSSNYPDRTSRLGATLTVNPFYEFAVGDLSPKQQTVSWRKQSGHVDLPVVNRGNSGATFRLDGDDDERRCRFEFDLPGEGVRLARQAEMRLAPEETWVLPVSITPIRRRLVGLRARSYSYTITTALVEAAQTPRSVMGQIRFRPLIGPLLLLLIAVGIVSLLAFLAWPGKPLLVREQPDQSEGGNGAGLDDGLPVVLAARDAQDLEVVWWGSGSAQMLQQQGGSITTKPDEAVTLRYDGSRFHVPDPEPKEDGEKENILKASLDRLKAFFQSLLNRLNAFFLELRLEFSSDGEEWRTAKPQPEFDGIAGTLEVVPEENGSYRLSADTWVSNLFPSLGKSDKVSVLVERVRPNALEFSAEPDYGVSGLKVTIYWEVEWAEELTLSWQVEGAAGSDKDILHDQELVRGSRELTLDETTTFTLIASNRFYTEVEIGSAKVTVVPPTPTPVPTPVIERFGVNPLEITAGETVRLSWQVTGADTLTIDPLDRTFTLLQGDLVDQPSTSITYTLTALKKEGAENYALSQVVVNTPTPTPPPTPVPQAPEVQVFDAVPKTIVEGDDTAVMLTWVVSGTTTDIQITGASVPITGLPRQGSISIAISEGTIFVLTAYNGQLSSSKHVQIGTVEATPVPPKAPVIDDFSADIDREEIVYIDYEAGVYMILEGADVTLEWVVQGDDYELELNGTQVSGDGRWLGPIDEDKDYQLKAENVSGYDTRDLYIRIAARVLPPPQDFTYDPITREFSWTYPRPDQIEGFRLYAVREGESIPVKVADTNTLPAPVPGDPSHVYTWTLPGDKCGIFFLVAVYKDPYNHDALTETDAAEDSWGVTCPTPTPTG